MIVADHKSTFSQLVDTIVRLGIVGILLYWSYLILQPFIFPMVWGAILAVASYPAYLKLATKLGGARKTAALCVCLFLFLVIILPSWYLGDSVVSGLSAAKSNWEEGGLVIPPASPQVKEWPLVGERLYQVWSLASRNLEEALRPLSPHIKTLGRSLLSGLAGAGLALLQLVFSIIITGLLLASSERLIPVSASVSKRLAPHRGAELLHDAELTVRSVARGIIGVAVIQAILAGIGLTLAGIPGAGLWALACLLLAVIQIGVFPVLLIATIYLFASSDALTAGLFMAWAIFVSLLDNVLKPLLLGKGAPVPMLVIFLGALGGFLRTGIIGLFVGAIVFSVAYKLFQGWVAEKNEG